MTATDRVLEVAADWVMPGAGSAVFPGAAFSSVAAGADLASLFTA